MEKRLNPLVSIIIPAYNKAFLTVKAVESVLHQTYTPIEIIVVDDGSKDDTGERLAAIQGIRYIYKENGGACSARNLGLKYAAGSYVGFLDCDDMYESEKVAECVNYLQEHPDAGFVHTAAYFTDENNQIVSVYSHRRSRKSGRIAERLIQGNFICNSTVIARRDCFDKAGGFDESIFPPADWDLWIRLAEIADAGYIDRPLTRYRVTDNYTFNRLELSRREELYVIEKYFRRHSVFPERLRRRALSNFHLRYAQCYLLLGNQAQLGEEFKSCLKYDPFNVKAMAQLAGYVLGRPWLKAELKRRILRHNTQTN